MFAHSLRLALPTTTMPGLAQPRDERGVVERWAVGQRQRACRRQQVGGVDVVLDQDRLAVQRAADSAVGALGIEAVGVVDGVGVERADAR